MNVMASQITGVPIVCSAVCSDADQREHQSSTSLAFGMGIRRWPEDSPHKGLITRKMFPFDDVTMFWTMADNCPKRFMQPLDFVCIFLVKFWYHRHPIPAMIYIAKFLASIFQTKDFNGFITIKVVYWHLNYHKKYETKDSANIRHLLDLE